MGELLSLVFISVSYSIQLMFSFTSFGRQSIYIYICYSCAQMASAPNRNQQRGRDGNRISRLISVLSGSGG